MTRGTSSRVDHVKKRSRSGAMFATFAGVVLGLAAASLVWAAWQTSDTFAAGVIAAGDLRLDTRGDQVWRQITPGLDPELIITNENVRLMPGDRLQIEAPITTYLRGENLNAGFTANFVRPVSDETQIEAMVTVLNAAGVVVAGPVALGTAFEVPGLQGTSAGVTADWTVVVNLTVLGDVLWVHELDSAAHTPTYWEGGALDVTLTQVRSGPGFLSGGGP